MLPGAEQLTARNEMPKKIPPPLAGQLPVPAELIERRIYLIRGQKVMLDAGLAELYQVETRVLTQAVRRNIDRFPEDFMFQLAAEEASALRSQTVILEAGRGRYSKYQPYAFTGHGVAMLSAVLRSKRAVQMNIVIIRAFVKMRGILASHRELAARIEKIEATQRKHTSVISVVIEEIKKLVPIRKV